MYKAKNMSNFNLREDFTWRNFLMRAALVVVTVGLIVWAMPRESHVKFHAEVGKPWRYSDFTAPFDFPILKSEQAIKRERDSILHAFEPYYKYDKDVEGRQIRRFVQDYREGLPGMSSDYISIIANRLHRYYQQGIISAVDYSTLHRDTSRSIRIVNGKKAVTVSIRRVFSTKAVYEQLFLDEKLSAHRQDLQKCNLNDYIVPNLIYDSLRSQQSLNDLFAGIPQATGIAQKGQKIIGRGDIVDRQAHRILDSFIKENDRRGLNASQQELTLGGELLYVLILVFCFTAYLTLFRRDYLEKPRSVAMLYSLIVIFALLTALLVRNTLLHVYLLPYAMLPMFIRVFMDSRTAFMTHVTMVLICAAMLQHSFEFIVVEVVAGLVAISSLRELSYRSQIFKTAIVVTLSMIAMQLAFDLINLSAISEFDASNYNYIIINGILLLFAYPLLYLMEKLFGFTSDITLIELSNTNNPLLRQLSEVAPGTFQHSIQVGNLAAEIANKIGAKSQLVRTGALYHDIGKMSKPFYFTENQSGIDPHERLSSIESAQIIISHVTEGLKLAEKHNLPDIIRDFINTHHGQGKAKYFFVKYKNEHPDDPVDELLFTYPGVNPFTREQAILMMADAVEAASRSLPEYTEQSIRQLVERIIDGQLSDGFFRDCPITFRDIAYAKTVLIEKLKTIYHTRVSYPELKK